jgi:hypothetical protein
VGGGRRIFLAVSTLTAADTVSELPVVYFTSSVV